MSTPNPAPQVPGIIPTTAAGELTSIPVDTALHAISDELDRHDQITGFLKPAVSEFAASGVEVFRNLGIAAVKAAASRPGATAVDKGDVERAYKQVSGQKAERKAWLMAVAGALASAAITSAVGVMLTPPTSHLVLWWISIAILSVASLVVGYFANPRKS